ncbi:polysaccharide biosynthesis/export family protein [Neptuniibacter sp. SY11_33]|uniref:polysaccharide biosynthesis/export family protein n=1 Tax=Neptuniibacter sp. SY11_33 TaxID=3398215 RepID=UPI0039F4ED89
MFKSLILILGLVGSLMLTFVLPVQASEDVNGLSDYPLGAGDLISIQVFGEEELSVEVRLSDAGTVSYPFLGELRVRDLNTGELSKLIRDQLADGYLVNPSVNVTVKEYRQFFIHGQVEKPGGYPYQPGLTLQKAVALAEGFTERASSSKFLVAREGASEAEAEKAELQTLIYPGDVITIDESFF